MPIYVRIQRGAAYIALPLSSYTKSVSGFLSYTVPSHRNSDGSCTEITVDSMRKTSP